MKPYMRITALALAALLLCLALFGCSSSNKRPPEESVIAEEALKEIEALRKAYIAKEFDALGQYTEQGLYFRVQGMLKQFEGVTLEFSPSWMKVDAEGKVQLRVDWEGKWRMGGGRTKQAEGTVVFKFEG